MYKTLSVIFAFTLSLNSFGQSLDISTYNIRNFYHDERSSTSTDRKVLIKTLNDLGSDVIAVQEIINAKAFASLIKNHLPQYSLILTQCGGSGRQKLGFLYLHSKIELLNFKEDSRLNLVKGCAQGTRPAAIAKFKIKSMNFDTYFINVHLKAGARQRDADKRARQYQLIGDILNEIKSTDGKNAKFVVTGDFNTTDYYKNNRNTKRFQNFILANELVSLTDELACTAYWWGGTSDGFEHPSFLDHMFISESFNQHLYFESANSRAHCEKNQCERATMAELGRTYTHVSDHCPIDVNLSR